MYENKKNINVEVNIKLSLYGVEMVDPEVPNVEEISNRIRKYLANDGDFEFKWESMEENFSNDEGSISDREYALLKKLHEVGFNYITKEKSPNHSNKLYRLKAYKYKPKWNKLLEKYTFEVNDTISDSVKRMETQVIDSRDNLLDFIEIGDEPHEIKSLISEDKTYSIERDLVLKILVYIMNTEELRDAEWGAGKLFEELPRYDDHENIVNGAGIKPEIYYELLEGILDREEDEEGNLDHDLYSELSHMLNRMNF